MSDSKGTILLVEDDRNDVFFLRYAFEAAGIRNPVQLAIDGQQAIDYLAGHGSYADRQRFPIPCLVLLDLKLPVRMGMEVLEWIHEHEELRNLLVVVLTSSSNTDDVDRSYQLGARSYLVKPLSVDRRLAMARLIKEYWLEMNSLVGSGAVKPC